MKNTPEILDRCRRAEAERIKSDKIILDRQIAILKSFNAQSVSGEVVFTCANCGAQIWVNQDDELKHNLRSCPTVRQILSELHAKGADQ